MRGYNKMNKTITNMLEFVNSGTTNMAEIEAAIAEIGKLQFRLVAISILSWLKSQKRMNKVLPLELDERHDWCRHVLRLVKDKAFLADLVNVKDTSILLLPGLTEEEVKKLLAFVDAEYRPRLMADPRR
jgi:hypothetical protein